jgi:LmbE family N-acetylglucosaminyl deacetylase
MAIVAHADDEVLGCGGTLAKHVLNGDEVLVLFMSNDRGSRQEDCSPVFSESMEALRILGIRQSICRRFPDQRFDTIPLLDITQSMELAVHEFQPKIVYTHNSEDCNPDHRRIREATRGACRSWLSSVKYIRLFEIPGNHYDLPFISNDSEDISDTYYIKIAALRAYKSEIDHWKPNDPKRPENIISKVERFFSIKEESCL